MTDNEFDDILKKRFHQHESDVPADMWQRIADNKKKRRFGYWWWYTTILLLLLIVSGGYIYYIARNKKTDRENIAAHLKNAKQKTDNNNSQHINEQNDSTAAINKNNITYSSANNDHTYALKKLQNINRSVIKNNSEQIFIADNDKPLQKQEYTNSTRKVTSNSDSVKKPAQKNQLTAQTVNNTNENADSIEETADHDKFSLQLFASPDLPFSNIQSSNNRYHETLKNDITMRLSYTLGAGITLAVSKKISLSTGIQYTRVNENISFDDSALSTHTTSVNYLSFINVPFIVHYKTELTSSFHTSVNAGVLVNISGRYKGIMPDPFGGTTNVSKVYKSNTAISLYAGINFSKSITTSTDVFIEPCFRFQTKNIADNLQPFTRKFCTAGLALGIQYRLFKND